MTSFTDDMKITFIQMLLDCILNIDAGLQTIIKTDRFHCMSYVPQYAWHQAKFYSQSVCLIVESMVNHPWLKHAVENDPFALELVNFTVDNLFSLPELDEIMFPKAEKLRELLDKYEIDFVSFYKHDYRRHFDRPKQIKEPYEPHMKEDGE